MKLSDIEKQFKVFADKQVNSTLQKEDIDQKNRVWQQVQSGLPKRERRIAVWMLAAASVVIIVLATFTYQEIQTRDEQIAHLKKELKQRINSEMELSGKVLDMENELTALQNRPPKIDTVYKTRTIYLEAKPVVDQLEPGLEFTKLEQNMNKNTIQLGDGRIDLASIQDDVESIKIEYGQKPKGGHIIPWTFKVVYN